MVYVPKTNIKFSLGQALNTDIYMIFILANLMKIILLLWINHPRSLKSKYFIKQTPQGWDF